MDRGASACSDDERAALAELGALPTNDDIGTGDRDGSCHAVLAGSGGDAAAQQAVIADVRGRLSANGWVPTGPVTDAATTYTRDGRTIVVAVTADKAIEVTATFARD